MGKSYILRNDAGEAEGYIQQIGKIIRCGIQRELPGGLLTLHLVYEGSDTVSKTVDGGGRESEWSGQDSMLLGGCLMRGEEILAYTHQDAKRLIQSRIRRERAASETREPQAAACAAKDSDRMPELPARRWPPNPCCPNCHA